MKQIKTITLLVILIALLSAIAAAAGIFSSQGTGRYSYTSIRGETVEIYGHGIYRHMSAEVAPQGIAQDYVTLLLGIPLLLTALLWARKGSLRARYLLAGILGYFLVTYLFYLAMGMYNLLFLIYVALLATTFLAFLLTIHSFDVAKLPETFTERAPRRVAAGFLLFSCIAIAILWLSVVVPPLVSGAIYPPKVEHYTTLIVQGLDLGLLLPLGTVTSVLWLRKAPLGYLGGPVYIIFLSLLMTALTGKIIAMGLLGYSIVPVIFIIPTFTVVATTCSVLLLKNIQDPAQR